ncbi:hypothetical protein FRC04_008096 [Tulasnella sp. 424]|nr:hypothetical protein FRC04_008096 [Tulasnella sp. 424]
MRISIPTIPLNVSGANGATMRPTGPPTSVQIQAAAERIATFLKPKNALVLTGAGYQELMDSSPKGHAFRQRYWAGGYLGWRHVFRSDPNPTHYALAALQYLDVAPRLITQNVDGLHQRASPFSEQETSNRTLELHGTLQTVRCLRGHRMPREEFQEVLSKLNPAWKAYADELDRTEEKPRTNPDGDVDLGGVRFADFVVPECAECAAEGHPGSILKLEVIFFGESIPDKVKERSFRMVDDSDRLLLVGTTLATFSAFRLVKHALEQQKPVLLLNLGPARTDNIPEVEKIELPSREVLLETCRLLAGTLTSEDQTLSRLLTSGVVKSPDLEDQKDTVSSAAR